MSDVPASDAARRWHDLLDGVEYRGERYRITRRGHAVALLGPADATSGAQAKAMLHRHRPDPTWLEELQELRTLLQVRPAR